MARLGKSSPVAPLPLAPPVASAEAPPDEEDDEEEAESEGEELYLCLVEALKETPIRARLALGRALNSGQDFESLPVEVQEICEVAAALVWDDEEDEG